MDHTTAVTWLMLTLKKQSCSTDVEYTTHVNDLKIGSDTYLLGWGEPAVKQPSYMATQTMSFEGAQLLGNMENDLFHVERTALSNKCCRNIIALKGKLHQLHQVTDMVKIRGSSSKLMVTGSDDPVTQCATLKAWPTLHIILQKIY